MTKPGPITPRIDAHVWGRSTSNPQPGAIIRAGRYDVFVADADIPALIERLQAIRALNN